MQEKDNESAPLAQFVDIFERIGGEERQMEILEGVGHWLAIEVPTQVLDKITSFYKQIQ